MNTIVQVTETEFRRSQDVFETAEGARCTAVPADEPALARAILDLGARYVIVGSVRYSSELYGALPRGGVIARFGVGHDGIDKEKATKAGLLCTNTPGVLDESVAELAVLLMLAASRHLPKLAADMRQGRWALGPAGAELRGKTLAVIGSGRIGQATARIASHGFGMRAIGCRRSAPASGVAGDFESVTPDFSEAVHDADYVSLHINAEAGNLRFLNRERLSMIPARAWLINTARGAVVDEPALYDALAGEHLGGAALDVFDREPYVPVDPARDLRTLPNVILTPHVGSHTREANRLMALRALQNILRAEARDFGGMDLLNPEVLGLNDVRSQDHTGEGEKERKNP
jgi:phosphoglycerate dehydrogenase-like enzyme